MCPAMCPVQVKEGTQGLPKEGWGPSADALTVAAASLGSIRNDQRGNDPKQYRPHRQSDEDSDPREHTPGNQPVDRDR